MLRVWMKSKPQHSFQLTFELDQIHSSSDRNSWLQNPDYRSSPQSSPKSMDHDSSSMEFELHSSPMNFVSSSNRISSPSSFGILRDERDTEITVERASRVVYMYCTYVCKLMKFFFLGGWGGGVWLWFCNLDYLRSPKSLWPLPTKEA